MARPSLQWMTSPAARRIAAVIALGAVAAPLTVRALRPGSHLRVATAQVTDGPIVRRITATGTLQALSTVQVGAQVSGTIEALGADYNALVHKGDVLARLDPALLQAALDEANASLVQAKAAHDSAIANLDGYQTAVLDARTKLTRAAQLADRQLIAPADLDAARIAFESASADLRSGAAQVSVAQSAVAEARAAVDQAKVNLDHTIITSPIDGIVVARNVDVGQTVAAAIQAPVLFQIAADVRQMQVEVDIDESDIGGVTTGDEVSFVVESYPNDTFFGTISNVRLQPVADQTTTATTVGTSPSTPATTSTIASVVSYATMVDVPNPDEKLRPGMTATVTLPGGRRARAVRIPSRALSFRPPPDTPIEIPESAAPLDPTDATHRRLWRFDGVRFVALDVTIGIADDRWTEMVDGPLRAGDSVVTGVTQSTGGRVN